MGVPVTLGMCAPPGPAGLQGGCQALGWAQSRLTPVVGGEGLPLVGNTWPKTCPLMWASPHKLDPKGPHPQHPRRGEEEEHSTPQLDTSTILTHGPNPPKPLSSPQTP